MPTLVLRAAEPRSPLTVWVQQVLHRILRILSQREKENIRTLTESKAKEDAHEGGLPTFPNLSRHFNMIERALDGSYHVPGDLQTVYLSFIYQTTSFHPLNTLVYSLVYLTLLLFNLLTDQ